MKGTKHAKSRAKATAAPAARREDLERLYAAAVGFRDAAPWRWMEDDRIIGVEEPASGWTGYCCVLGALGSVFGLAVYNGAEGYHQYERINSGAVEGEDFEVGITQDCLLVTFEPRAELTDRDRREIGALGLKFRGPRAWPLFRSSRPGYLPWYLEGGEVVRLATALEQATEVCVRIGVGAGIAPQQIERPLLVRRWDASQGVWRDAWDAVPERPVDAPVPSPARARIERLLRAKVRTTLAIQAALTYLPTPVLEDLARPFFPRVWMIVDAATGMLSMSDLLLPDLRPGELQEGFLAALEERGSLPAEIRTASEESFALLAPAAEALGVRLRRVRATRHLQRARDALEQAFGGRAGASDPWD